jgi:hypothetical protein
VLPVETLPDAEVVTLEYLRPRLTAIAEWQTAKLGTVVGTSRPFVQLRRVGGSSEWPGVDAPTLDVIVYHDTDHNRMRLAHACWALLRSAASDATDSGVVSYVSTLLGPRQMPDPADTTKRVAMFTVDLLTRARL